MTDENQRMVYVVVARDNDGEHVLAVALKQATADRWIEGMPPWGGGYYDTTEVQLLED